MTPVVRTPAFLRSDRIPPSLRAALGEVLDRFPDGLILDDEPDHLLLSGLETAFERGEGQWARIPELAELGRTLLDPRQHPEIRRWGCIWLTQYPTLESIEALRGIALDAGQPKKVRDQAAWSLGFRQIQSRHPSLRWSAEALARADETLLALVEQTGEKQELEQLPLALRHVDRPEVLAAIGRRPRFWSEALEAFATPAIAADLLAHLEEVPEKDAFRLLRLATATLREEAVPRLVELASSAPLDTRLELIFSAIAFAGERVLPELEQALAGLRFADLLRKRARWHLDHPGVIPTVRGLQVARRTALLAAEERPAACAAAADDLGALTAFARHPETYLYTMWAHLVVGAGDPERARALVEAHPDSAARVLPLLLTALARRGRVGRLLQVAQQHGDPGRGAWELARHGRPFAALALCELARDNAPPVAAARALACFLAGRPDLTDRLLATDPPRAEVLVDSLVTFEDATLQAPPGFPGVDEKWWLDNAPAERPDLQAWQGGVEGLLGLCQGEPASAEGDRVDLGLFARIEKRVRRELAGATVCLVGEFADRPGLEAKLTARGARLVDGPFAGVDFYVFEKAPCSVVAKLERFGARLFHHYPLT